MRSFLLAAVAVLGLVTVTSGQVLQSGPCRAYQGSTNFTTDFIDKMVEEERSYLFMMSSGSTLSCQRIQFFQNKTFLYSYIDPIGIDYNYTGSYETEEHSPIGIGTIKLIGLPYSVLQTGHTYETTLNVVAADDEQLLIVSCVDLAIMNWETVHGLVDEKMHFFDENGTLARIKTTIDSIGFNRADQIVEQSHNCVQSRDNLIKIYDLLIKLGLIPNIPFLRDFLVKLGLSGSKTPRFYSALEGMPFYGAAMNNPSTQIQQVYLGGQAGIFVPYGAIPQQHFNPMYPGTIGSANPYSQIPGMASSAPQVSFNSFKQSQSPVTELLQSLVSAGNQPMYSQASMPNNQLPQTLVNQFQSPKSSLSQLLYPQASITPQQQFQSQFSPSVYPEAFGQSQQLPQSFIYPSVDSSSSPANIQSLATSENQGNFESNLRSGLTAGNFEETGRNKIRAPGLSRFSNPTNSVNFKNSEQTIANNLDLPQSQFISPYTYHL